MSSDPDGFVIRIAMPADTSVVVKVFNRSKSESLPWLPVLHTLEEDHWFVEHQLIRAGTVFLVEEGGRAVAMCALKEGFVEQLYVLPESQGKGIGRLLINRCKEQSPTGLQLWCFQQNDRALAFYAAMGFEVVRLTDGDNEEGLPDALLAWPPDGTRAPGDAIGIATRNR